MRFTTHSSPFKKSQTQSITTLLVGAMLITPMATAYDAHADDNTPPKIDSKKLKRQILASLDYPELALPLQNDSEDASSEAGFRLSKKGPIQYRQVFQIGDDNVLLKLYGPVVRKKPGLRFRLEGLHLGDLPVDVEGFGNVREGRFRVTIRY